MNERRPSEKPQIRWTRLAGMGTELAGAILALTLLGWWVDRRFETEPWGLLIGACLGIVGGLYNLIRVAVREALGVDKKTPDDRQETEADEK